MVPKELKIPKVPKVPKVFQTSKAPGSPKVPKVLNVFASKHETPVPVQLKTIMLLSLYLPKHMF